MGIGFVRGFLGTERGIVGPVAEFTYFRAGRIVAGAVLLVLLALPAAAMVFDRVEPFDISDPGSEVERAYDAYEAATGMRLEPEVLVLVRADGETSAGGEASAEAVADRLGEIEGVARVVGPAQDPALTSADGDLALVLGVLDAGDVRAETGERVAEEFAGDENAVAGGIAVANHQIAEEAEQDTRRIELYAAPLLLLLLFGAFRSVLAALLPLVLAAFSIAVTLALLTAISELVDIDLFSLQVVTGLGVGLAIDYSLFVLARYRAEVRRGNGYEAAHRRTVATAGRTVAFGALTVAAALAALIIFPQQYLSSTGIAGGLVALLSGASALIVLPALLALVGPRVDPGFEQTAPGEDPPPDPLGGGSRFWRLLGGRVMTRPIPLATLALLLMLAVSAPGLDGDLTSPDGRVLPPETSAKRVFDSVERFPDLAAGQISVVVPAGAAGGLGEAREELAGSPELEPAGSEKLPGGGTRLVYEIQADPVSDPAQARLEEVRAAPWPEGTLVGGRTAELADQRASIGDYAPLVIAVVVLTNLLLVLVTIRSVVLPVISIALNALTVLASFGVVVALFETEATAELLGASAQTGIDVSVPVLAFAVVFGLSTDYGIFLFASIAEARARGHGETEAITIGLARTGRIITSAAVIFAIAVGANAFSDLVLVKEFAVAVAVAVLLDATIVRGILVPAILKLLGGRAWWWPGSGRRGEG